jgi:hypothetical protein
MLAVLAFIALYSSVDGFQTGRAGRMSSRALRMSSEEAWFPASVTSNIVEFDSLRLITFSKNCPQFFQWFHFTFS